MSVIANQETKVSGTTNTQEGSVVKTTVPTAPLVFFSPYTAEIIVVDNKNRLLFLQEVVSLEKIVTAHMEARLASEAAQHDLLDLKNHAELQNAQQALNQRLNEEEATRKKLADAFKTVSPGTDKDMMELLPMWSSSSKEGIPRGKKFIYVRSDKVKSHVRAYKLSKADKTEMKSFLLYDAQSKKWQLDKKKLIESFKQIELTEKRDLFDTGIQEWTSDFTRAFNDNAHFASPETVGEMTEYGYGAKLLRCFSGASGDMEGAFNTSMDDILKGKLKVKAAVKGRGEVGLMLAEGKANFKIMLPHREGFELSFLPAVKYAANGTTQVDFLSLGFFRLSLNLGSEGSAGASALAEGGIELELDSKGVQKAKGRHIKRDAKSMARRQMKVNNFSAAANAGAELNAFAGAKAGVSVDGAFEWQRPNTTEFGEFAKITPKVEGMAGLGGGGAFDIGYFPKEKKFKVVVKLAGCVGLGVSGKIGAEIGAGHILEFSQWFRHQVVASMDSNLKYFKKVAFEAFCAMYLLAIVEGKKLGEYLGQKYEALLQQISNAARYNAKAFIAAIRKADTFLRMAIANIKGLINFLLQQIYNRFDDLRDDAGKTLKWLFGSIYQSREYANVLEHSFGDFTTKGDVVAARSRLVNIIGISEIASLEGRLKNIPADGYVLARNDDPLGYSMQIGTHMAWLGSSTLTA